ncbi:hypothetical protein CY35_06G099700 [Sphagnum magellanicum]|nr:hypothetical protein CY35_06G099700 [Sphagnum magellanicum]KAH9560327.1 hypothetical protein CY35_06G099700 [Sphagnum magellanicum]KAH9560328.1 hypothetical protein CY35_06G099700 [Sphagnum magellanicum]
MPALGGGTPTTSHASTQFQFLGSVLSQRGPSALPYIEDDKLTIRQHLLHAIQEFPGLQVKTAIFTHNDGRTSNLLQADGTIPMCYQDVMYNIPITMWLLESYPRNCPLVFVTPTRDMIIKPRHPYVNPSGMVSAPYLQAWVYPRSNLVELVQSLSLLFGNDPPLYSRLPPAPMSSHLPQSTSPFMNPMHTGGQMPPPSMLSSGLHPPVQPTSRPSYPPYQNSQPPPRTDEPSEAYKWSLINTLSDRLHHDTQALMQDRNTEMDRLFNTQALLGERAGQLQKGVRELVQEKEGLENQLQLILTNTDVLESWLKANDKGLTQVDIDDVFEPADALSKQLLECNAADFSIEDILYSLDKAAQEGAIPVDAYLKQVRVLSREQFISRATSIKIYQAQLSS